MLNLISKQPLLQAEKIAVSHEGELVVIKIGNTELKIHYEGALKLSQFIRINAKKAKHQAGDMSRHWSAIATLSS